MNEEFYTLVYNAVKAIPKGSVATYGYIAAFCGFPRHARQVGFALHRNPDPSTIPCHRVVAANGACAGAFAFGGAEVQQNLLKGEGVTFLDNGNVDIKKHALR